MPSFQEGGESSSRCGLWLAPDNIFGLVQENGGPFLFVRGDCRFWVNNVANARYRTGDLREFIPELSADLFLGQWQARGLTGKTWLPEEAAYAKRESTLISSDAEVIRVRAMWDEFLAGDHGGGGVDPPYPVRDTPAASDGGSASKVYSVILRDSLPFADGYGIVHWCVKALAAVGRRRGCAALRVAMLGGATVGSGAVPRFSGAAS